MELTVGGQGELPAELDPGREGESDPDRGPDERGKIRLPCML